MPAKLDHWKIYFAQQDRFAFDGATFPTKAKARARITRYTGRKRTDPFINYARSRMTPVRILVDGTCPDLGWVMDYWNKLEKRP